MKPISEQNFYELLDVPVNASSEAIEAAYERAMRELGPDSIATYTLVSPEESAALLSRIEDAYLTLTDPALRAEYDAGVLAPDLRALPRAEPEAPRAPELSAPAEAPEEKREPAQQLVLAPVLESPAVESWPARLDVPVLGRADVGVLPDAPREIVVATEPRAPEPQPAPVEVEPERAAAAVAPERRSSSEAALLETDKVGILPAANDDVTDDAKEEPVAVEAAEQASESDAATSSDDESDGPVDEVATAPVAQPADVAAMQDEDAVEAAASAPGPVAALAEDEPESEEPEPAREAAEEPEVDEAEPEQAGVAIEPLAIPTLPSRPAPPEPLLEPIPPPKEERKEPPRALPRMPEIGATTVINGELLRAAREGRGMTLRELSDKTKIGVNHLENIEADHYAALPVAVYLRGFLMSVARELKLDPLRISKGYLETLAVAKGRQGS